eukprot:1593765-Prymnesium_polylepis.1
MAPGLAASAITALSWTAHHAVPLAALSLCVPSMTVLAHVAASGAHVGSARGAAGASAAAGGAPPRTLFQQHSFFFCMLALGWLAVMARASLLAKQRTWRPRFGVAIPCLQILTATRVAYVQVKIGMLPLGPILDSTLRTGVVNWSHVVDATATTLPYAAMLAGHALLSECYQFASLDIPLRRTADLVRLGQPFYATRLRPAFKTCATAAAAAVSPSILLLLLLLLRCP